MFRLAAFDEARFLEPAGERALAPPDSMSWRIFKNPVTLFIGGVAAVILELAEPAVRTGVWEHTDFRRDPMRRLERTGLAAMVTVYSARSVAQAMIAHIVRMHDRVEGVTPTGERYRANDPKLLRWVQATAAHGFIEAYSRYGRPLTPAEIDQAYAESAPAAALYGAHDSPLSDAERQALFDAMRGRLEPSPIIFEFLDIMRRAPIVPWPVRPVQWLLLRAAVELTPGWVRERLGLGERFGLRRWQRPLVRLFGALADRVVLPFSPAVRSCRRLGLPADYLYRRRGTG
ncbi:MAG: DUF2236 domain-containing protein [Proteobacteria bacterium]|nr:DUF2236 domain-containing protein [Pseudomonadota bacterium]